MLRGGVSIARSTSRLLAPSIFSQYTVAASFTPFVRSLHSTRPSLEKCDKGHEQTIHKLLEDHLMNSDPELDDILANNKRWVQETNKKDPSFFPTIGAGQKPRYLYIGCSDARVDPTIMMSLKYGELFIHRNVGNIVCGTDLNFLTVLEFAVTRLKVPHIIVCGHYDCGAVRASVQPTDHGIIENWLRNIRDVYRLHKDELEAIEDPELRHRRLVERHIMEQCLNILKTGCVQRLRQETKASVGLALPRVHALVFDPAEGILKKLNVNWKEETRQYDGIYRLYK